MPDSLDATEDRAIPTGQKVCPTCGETKALDDFYPHPQTRDGRHPRCKKCDNAKPRKTTAAKVNRMRARHRALADLIKFHEEEFQALLAIRLAEAREEADALAVDPKGAAHYKNEPVRLKPGKRMAGEKAGDRIDVARCSHCIKHHDRGHVCTKCGAAPAAALRRPEDGVLDDVAIERAMGGDPVQLTATERAEAVRRLAARGVSDAEIASALHCDPQTVLRWRRDHEIESRWSA